MRTVWLSQLIGLVILLTPLTVFPQEQLQHFSQPQLIFVVRHAEKLSGANPRLSQMGRQRAQSLATLLSHAEIKHIYSTAYHRTEETAGPLAERLQLSVTTYAPTAYEQLAAQVEATGEHSLIVGHSNTVAAIILALGGDAKPLSESDYGDLFVVFKSAADTSTTRLMIPTTAEPGKL